MPYRPGALPIRILRFEEIVVGQQAELVHELTESDVAAFASLTGDFNPIHVDSDFARKTSFRQPVAHGMLSASFISTLIGTQLPGAGALWVSQTLEFQNPARIGDVLTVRATVKRKSEASRNIVLDIEILRQDGQRLVSGESVVKVLETRDDPHGKQLSGNGLTVLVTGGSRGIGAAIADRLAADGHSVVVNYRDRGEDAKRITSTITDRGQRALAVGGDVSRKDEVDAVFRSAQEAFGPVLGVVHCAGSGSLLRAFGELDWSAFERQLDVHLKGAFYCAQAALPAMVTAERGSMVFVSSTAAEGVPPVQQADYVVAKAAVAALARSLAAEYGPKGIRVNIVAPGMTNTDMIAGLPEKARLLTRMQTPLRRLGDPSDVAAAASFLLSPGSRHITGETLRVCGGIVMS